MERLSNGPHWVLRRTVPSEDKTFARLQKGGLPALKRKVQTPFLKRNKMERLAHATPSVLLSQSHRGIKNFQDFKKADGKWGF